MDSVTNILLLRLSEEEIYYWETVIADYFFIASLVFLAFELIRYLVNKRLGRDLVADTVTNFITLALFIGINYLVLAAFYLTAYSWAGQFALFDIEINWATTIVCVVLADLLYYWEHRFMHRVNLGWATHTVHHSSPHFNISVAYRFGPMDAVWPIFFSINLVLLGFNPFVVFFAEMFVQLYQTILHTETIKKLPRPIEAIFNTPSHHRVHHGVNRQYWDKNYAGIFIIWDRMFGTFVEEEEPVRYGVSEPLNTANPFTVFLHGFTRLFRDVGKIPGSLNKLKAIIKPPGWQPANRL
ncbi:MAG: sterol desaturase family protein [Pseudomonadota bacterium]